MNPGTHPASLRQFHILGEAAYYSKDLHLSFFGKFEMRKINSDYDATIKAANNVMWIAGGLKYYVAEQLMNFGLQYERIQFPDAPDGAQAGTNNVTFQMQVLLY